MEDLLLTCTLLSRLGTGRISLHENHECQSMKFFRLIETMEEKRLKCALLSQCGTGPTLPCEILSVEHGQDSLSR